MTSVSFHPACSQKGSNQIKPSAFDVLDHQPNYRIRPLEVLSLLSFQYVDIEEIFPISPKYWLLFLMLWALGGGSGDASSDGRDLYEHGSYVLQPASLSLKAESCWNAFLLNHVSCVAESQKHGPLKLWLLNLLLCIAGAPSQSSAKKIKLSIRLVEWFFASLLLRGCSRISWFCCLKV